MNRKDIVIHHIHEDISGVSSIIFGFDYYVGSLTKVQDYVKVNYKRGKMARSKNIIYEFSSIMR